MSVATARRETGEQREVRLRLSRRARRLSPSVPVCLGVGLAAFLVSRIVSASIAELANYEAKRMTRAADAVRDITDLERERADRRSTLRAVEHWAARNGFVDGRSPEAE
ncbi:MAG: hypothetical protein IT207_09095 [Fimbriimonadaceae bacterium]|nr:hypothetical protein [Fimbriimonadaceae bacterium]